MQPASTPMRNSRTHEAGAITILVTLMLLVLLTVWAIAMSKNALRETIITGTSRQGAQVRNLADTGIEWSVFWMMDDLTGSRATPAAGTGAYYLRAMKSNLIASQQTGILSSALSTADMILSPSGANPAQRYEVFLTYMGNPRVKFTQSEVRSSSISAATPGTVQLWAVRSDGYLEYSGGPSFVHRREAWFTVPPSTQQ